MSITIKQLHKAFGNQVIFDGLDMTFPMGKTVISGANGCGKTTLLMMIAGIEPVDSGQILCGDSQSGPSNISIASDKIRFPEFLTAKEVTHFIAQQWGQTVPMSLVDALGFDYHWHHKVDELSSGNLKKLQLIAAVTKPHQWLLMDEPIANLDEHSVNLMLEYLNASETNMIITSHEHKASFAELETHHLDLEALQ